jgi:hypothetical protein
MKVRDLRQSTSSEVTPKEEIKSTVVKPKTVTETPTLVKREETVATATPVRAEPVVVRDAPIYRSEPVAAPVVKTVVERAPEPVKQVVAAPVIPVVTTPVRTFESPAVSASTGKKVRIRNISRNSLHVDIIDNDRSFRAIIPIGGNIEIKEEGISGQIKALETKKFLRIEMIG